MQTADANPMTSNVKLLPLPGWARREAVSAQMTC